MKINKIIINFIEKYDLPVNYSMTKVRVIVWTVVSMIVRSEQMYVEPLEVNLADSQSFASKPVSMK